MLQEGDIRNVSAGGGQSLAVSSNLTVKALSPPVYGHLEEIYKGLIRRETRSGVDGPDTSSFDAFQAWFQSSDSSALAPPIEHDLSYPLSNYYISSSHNTYILHGSQLTGRASPEAYAHVLRRGCRCVELDVYDPDEDASLSSSDDEGASKSSKTNRSGIESLKARLFHRQHNHGSPSTSPPTQGMNDLSVDENGMSSLTRTVSNADRLHLLRTEPTVYHGHTKVNRIAFREVCRTVRESAFQTSSLPVILSLEVHASAIQQQLMVDILTQELAGHLVDVDTDIINVLPSPDALRNKILIKVKTSSNVPRAGSDNLGHIDTNDTLTMATTRSSADTSTSATSKPKKPSKVIEALARLGHYTHAYSFKHFDQPEASYPTHVFSLSESALQEIHEDVEHGEKMFQHNRDYMLRIYPIGIAVTSENYDPTFAWRQGAQIVALNWQKLDLGMMLNEGMFAGEEGYVLKPEGFRGTAISQRMRPQRHHLNLTIQLMAAQDLPLVTERSSAHAHGMRPYVKLQLHVDTHGPPGSRKKSGVGKASRFSKYSMHRHGDEGRGEDAGIANSSDDEDEASSKLKRHSKASKTCTPDFAGAEFSWTNVPDVIEQLSFVRFKVHEEKSFAADPLVAWACIRLDRLKTGYRFVHLLDHRGEPCEGVLLVKIDKALQAHH